MTTSHTKNAAVLAFDELLEDNQKIDGVDKPSLKIIKSPNEISPIDHDLKLGDRHENRSDFQI